MARVKIPNSYRPLRVPIGHLKSHKKNYRSHPDDQIEHIQQSLKENGFYRNVVVAKDNTILAGHGVVEAARRLGIKEIPVIKLSLDPNSPQALKILIGDNMISQLAEVDDRLLMETLQEVKDLGTLLGTGYDEKLLANLTAAFSSGGGVEGVEENGEVDWEGFSDNEPKQEAYILKLYFETETEMEKFVEAYGIIVDQIHKFVWSASWPSKEKRGELSLLLDG